MENVTEIEHRMLLSECTKIQDAGHLAREMTNAMQAGLEGLVLKDSESTYEPNMRRWLKFKKVLEKNKQTNLNRIVLN